MLRNFASVCKPSRISLNAAISLSQSKMITRDKESRVSWIARPGTPGQAAADLRWSGVWSGVAGRAWRRARRP